MSYDIVDQLREHPVELTRCACARCKAADMIEQLRFAGDRLAAAYEAETQPQSDREWAITQMWEEARRG